MPRTYSAIYLHVIFATKARQAWLGDDIGERVHALLGGIVRDLGGSALAIGGVEDHVHLLIKWRTDETIATLKREVKSRSSRWIHEELGVGAFAWQEGYSVFSVSRSGVDDVRSYIAKQVEHHRVRSFKEELIEFLERHGVEWDREYTFD